MLFAPVGMDKVSLLSDEHRTDGIFIIYIMQGIALVCLPTVNGEIISISQVKTAGLGPVYSRRCNDYFHGFLFDSDYCRCFPVDIGGIALGTSYIFPAKPVVERKDLIMKPNGQDFHLLEQEGRIGFY
ncbi:MAG: hypothetical protein CM1200mP10_07900 [Candidatus Neomarinimicrobiota bacterium]|nr:MAG: hypothetical protein CM1200mP10_07900 [Candidatus Neomarinimicrobiota bacterium]